MNKGDLVTRVAEKAGLQKREAERAVDAFIETVQEALASGDKVTVVGFGTFEVRERQARMGRNPQTGEQIQIAAARVPVFRPGKGFKESV